MIACKSGRELLELDALDTVRYLASGSVRRLDLTLCDAVAASLDGAGVHIGADVARLRIAQHSVGDDPKELTEFYYNSAVPGIAPRRWTSRSFPNNRGSRTDFTAALWDKSMFLFIAQGGKGIVLGLTYRVPMATNGSTVVVGVNGRQVAELPAQSIWCTRDIPVEGSVVVDGVNEVLISWPTAEPPSEALIECIVDELSAQRLPRFGRVFGEIHTLSAFVSAGFRFRELATTTEVVAARTVAMK
jgi:hypothetical protein